MSEEQDNTEVGTETALEAETALEVGADAPEAKDEAAEPEDEAAEPEGEAAEPELLGGVPATPDEKKIPTSPIITPDEKKIPT